MMKLKQNMLLLQIQFAAASDGNYRSKEELWRQGYHAVAAVINPDKFKFSCTSDSI
jgi:hypothetical protein